MRHWRLTSFLFVVFASLWGLWLLLIVFDARWHGIADGRGVALLGWIFIGGLIALALGVIRVVASVLGRRL